MMEPSIVAALIGTGVTVALAVLALAWRMGRVIERLDSIQYAAKVRQDGINRRWQLHEDRHIQMERRWEAHLIRVPGDA